LQATAGGDAGRFALADGPAVFCVMICSSATRQEEGIMSKVSTGRVILAGLVAGLVINVIDFVVNVPILGKQWADATAALGVKMDSQANVMSAVGWIAMDFVAGLFAAWLYAAIRPRYGAGAKTALLAGLATWFITHVPLGSLSWNGLYPVSLFAASAAGALVAILAGGWVAGRLYSEAA
jgi:hypothetical protein